jgi:hypothetical protein
MTAQQNMNNTKNIQTGGELNALQQIAEDYGYQPRQCTTGCENDPRMYPKKPTRDTTNIYKGSNKRSDGPVSAKALYQREYRQRKKQQMGLNAYREDQALRKRCQIDDKRRRNNVMNDSDLEEVGLAHRDIKQDVKEIMKSLVVEMKKQRPEMIKIKDYVKVALEKVQANTDCKVLKGAIWKIAERQGGVSEASIDMYLKTFKKIKGWVKPPQNCGLEWTRDVEKVKKIIMDRPTLKTENSYTANFQALHKILSYVEGYEQESDLYNIQREAHFETATAQKQRGEVSRAQIDRYQEWETIKSIKDDVWTTGTSKDVLLYSLYRELPIRRGEYRDIRITFDNSDKAVENVLEYEEKGANGRKKANWIIFNNNRGYKAKWLVLQSFKTDGNKLPFIFSLSEREPVFERLLGQYFDLDDLNNAITRYARENKLQDRQFLFPLGRNRFEGMGQTHFTQKTVQKLFHEFTGVSSGVQALRTSFKTWFDNTQNPTAEQTEYLANWYAHTVSTASTYVIKFKPNQPMSKHQRKKQRKNARKKNARNKKKQPVESESENESESETESDKAGELIQPNVRRSTRNRRGR